MPFPVPGGSVLVSCRVDDIVRGPDKKPILDANGNIQLIPHGYVKQFDQYKDLITSHLQQMFTGAQRRLGFAIAFLSGSDTFALDATNGKLITQDRTNLVAIIQTAMGIGFEEFLLEMIPEWDFSYDNWMKAEVMGPGEARPFQPLKYGLMLSFIDDVWNTVQTAVNGTRDVYIDLLGECSNTEVGGRLWSDWCVLHPDFLDLATEIGFSQVPTQDTLDKIPKMYPNGKRPLVWNVHPYNNTGTDNAEMTWQHYKAKLSALYPNEGFIIGEISTNDPKSAAAIALDLAGLFWILQWPVLSGITPDGVEQDRLTLGYAAYLPLVASAPE